MTWTEVVSTLTLVAVVAAVVQLRLHNQQMHRDFEGMYVQRYWALMDRRSSSFQVEGRPSTSDAAVIHAYLQLCEDELDLRRVGRITDSTWVEWARWIREQCDSAGYVEALDAAPADNWPRLREHLASQGAGSDPVEHGRVWRFLHGL